MSEQNKKLVSELVENIYGGSSRVWMSLWLRHT